MTYAINLITTNHYSHRIIPVQLTEINHFLILVFYTGYYYLLFKAVHHFQIRHNHFSQPYIDDDIINGVTNILEIVYRDRFSVRNKYSIIP
jgi:hypothetical protein